MKLLHHPPGIPVSSGLRLLVLGVACAALAACASPTPVAQTYPLTSQPRMQSVQHWNVLAGQIAEDIAHWSPTAGIVGRPLSLGGGGSPFARGFEGFLATRLGDLGFTVAPDSFDSVRIEHEELVIHHNGLSPGFTPGTFTLLGSGAALGLAAGSGVGAGALAGGTLAAGLAADLAAGHVTDETNTELVVTVRALDRGQVVFRRDFTFYINDADIAQYGADVAGIRMLVDRGSEEARQRAWRLADRRCGEHGGGKAMLRADTPVEDKRELRFDCVENW